MKFASLNNGPDGQVILVSRDLQCAITIPGVASSLQDILDQWEKLSPSIEEGYRHLNAGEWNDAFQFESSHCTAPLPRACQWLKDSNGLHTMEQQSSLAKEAPAPHTDKLLLHRSVSDNLLGPRAPLAGKDSWGMDFQASLAVITDQIPMGCPAEEAHQYIRLIALCNDVYLRNFISEELSTGFGLFHSKPCSSFSPVAVTPDELGEFWQNGRLNLDIQISFNGQPFSSTNCSDNALFNFHEMIACAATTRHLGCGTIFSTGPIAGQNGLLSDCSSLAEKRAMENLTSGAQQSEFMKDGDRVKMEIVDPAGQSIFGAIEQIYRSI